MTQKGDPYAKLFSILSGVILMSCILSQLNILCNNLIKPYFTEWRLTRYSPFTCYDHFTCSPTYCIWSEQGNQYIKTFSTLSGVRTVFLIYRSCIFFAQVQWNDTAIKTTIHSTRVACFLCAKVHESNKNLLPSSLDLNLVNSLLWRALQQKLYRQEFRDVECLTRVLLHCWVR